MSTTDTKNQKTSVELATWLLWEELQSDGTFVEYGNDALFGSDAELGPLGKACTAIEAGDMERAISMLREAVYLADKPIPEIKEGRNRADRQCRTQGQRARFLNVALIALRLLEGEQ